MKVTKYFSKREMTVNKATILSILIVITLQGAILGVCYIIDKYYPIEHHCCHCN